MNAYSMSFSSDVKDQDQIYNEMMPDYNKSREFSLHEVENGESHDLTDNYDQ